MRLIDADALLEQYGLRDATKYGNENAEQQHKSYGTLMMYEIADMIYDAPTIEPPSNWTPCSVGLPEDNAKDSDGDDIRYIVTVKRDYRSGYIGRYTCTAVYADGAWWSAETQNIIDESETVIAWNQKPEPYRGEA